MTTKKFFRYLILTIIILIVASLVGNKIIKEEPLGIDKLKCIIALNKYKSKNINFDIGYNYQLIEYFASAMRCSIDIELSNSMQEAFDSIKNNNNLIIIIPYIDTLNNNLNYKQSQPLRDSTSWVVNANNLKLSKEITMWLAHNKFSPAGDELAQLFAPKYTPGTFKKIGTITYISPYDELIKKYAKKIDWDYRLLAALVWKESKYRIEAHSRKGARGLMQIMPKTFNKFTTKGAINPQISLQVGAKYINRLSKIFKKYAKHEELSKFVLAAYNAGEGRIMDCINYAQAHSLPYEHWADIKHIIQLMKEDHKYRQTHGLTEFKGEETMAYVAKVMDIYSAICSISSLHSVKGEHLPQKDTVAKAKAKLQDKTQGHSKTSVPNLN